jgi:hypothetical protein
MLPTFLRPDVPELPEDVELPNYIRQELKRNNAFQADVRLFQEDLAAGRYEPKWLDDAQAAMEKRGQGHFDDWKEKNREEFWGQKQKVDWTALSSDSAQYTLTDLAVAGLFEVGDLWVMRRSQGHTKDRVEVEKEAKVGLPCMMSMTWAYINRSSLLLPTVHYPSSSLLANTSSRHYPAALISRFEMSAIPRVLRTLSSMRMED